MDEKEIRKTGEMILYIIKKRNKLQLNSLYGKIVSKTDKKFDINDIVEIDYSANIDDLVRNEWNCCQLDTLSFLRCEAEEKGKKKYIITKKIDNECVNLQDLKGKNYPLVNVNILKLSEEQNVRSNNK